MVICNCNNLTEKMYALFASVIFKIALGKNFQGSNFDNSRFQKLIHEAETIVGCFSAEEYLSYVGWIINRLTGYHAKVNRIFLKLDTFFQQVIHDHLKPGRNLEQEDIVDVLLNMERDQTGTGDEQFTKDNIKAVLLNLFLGAVGKGAATAVWTMAELARNPRAMKIVQEEIRKSVGIEGSVSEGNAEQLPYLKMVIKETLRLHPPAPLLIAREAMGHFIINGYDIYPKMLIHVNVWAIGRDPKYWKDPEESFPERFADSSVDFRGQHFEFLPFGSGRRVCPGILLGTRMVELVIANVLHCFDWKLPGGMNEEDMNMEEAPGITISKKIALHLMPVNYIPQAPGDHLN